jgi:hypothetical protein
VSLAPDEPQEQVLLSSEQVPLSDDAPQVFDALTCETCGRSFRAKNNLANHLKTHGPHVPRASRAKKDKAPASVTINLGKDKPTKDPVLDAVQERARQLANLCGMLVLGAGQADDAIDIINGAEAWSQAVRELAVYEAWLRKLAAGGEESGRALAWFTFVVATIGMVLPILLRHEVLPEKLAHSLKTAMSLQETIKSGTPTPAPASV